MPGPKSCQELLDTLRGDLDACAPLGYPVRQVGLDSDEPVWVEVVPLVVQRSDWLPAVGQAVQRLLAENYPLAAVATADLLGQHLAMSALVPWLEPFAAALENTRPTRNPLVLISDGPATFGKLFAQMRDVHREYSDPTRPVRLHGQFGPAVEVPLRDAADLRTALARSAERGLFSYTPWGSDPLAWLWPADLGRPWVGPALPAAMAELLSGSPAQVAAATGWLQQGRDLWRHVETLRQLCAAPPPWWNAPFGGKPKGWSKQMPVEKAWRGRTWGERFAALCQQAERQAGWPGGMGLGDSGDE